MYRLNPISLYRIYLQKKILHYSCNLDGKKHLIHFCLIYFSYLKIFYLLLAFICIFLFHTFLFSWDFYLYQIRFYISLLIRNLLIVLFECFNMSVVFPKRCIKDGFACFHLSFVQNNVSNRDEIFLPHHFYLTVNMEVLAS